MKRLALSLLFILALCPHALAVPSVIATAKNNVNADADGTGITVTHGFTLANNDVLYAVVAQGDDPGTAFASSSGGTWSAIVAFQSTATGTDRAAQVLRRVVTNAGGEPATYTFTVTGSTGTETLVAIVVQVRGANTTTPEDASTTTSDIIDDFTPDNVTITTATNNALVLIAHLGAEGSTQFDPKTGGAPSGWTLHNTETFDDGVTNNSLFLEVASKVQTTAGLVTPGAWTGTPDGLDDGYTFAVAIRAAASRRRGSPVIFQ